MSQLQDRLNELLEYRDGKVYWKVDRGAVKCKGKEAGSIRKDGYAVINSSATCGSLAVHRAVWIMHHGKAPEFLDHINGDKTDNRIENLRPATKSQNGYNIQLDHKNVSGVKNVTWRGDTNNWRVTMKVEGKKKSFGSYDDLELAELVAHEARCKYHGEFANHGVSA